MSEFKLSFLNRLDFLHKEIEGYQSELKKLRVVYYNFPDVEVSLDKWGRATYYATSAIPKANDFLIVQESNTFSVKPYLNCYGLHVCSFPNGIWIGDTSEDYVGVIFHSNWQEILQEKGVPAAVIDKLQLYKETNRADPFDDLPPEEIQRILEEGKK